MSDAWRIRNFLIQRPPAATIRLTSVDGEVSEMKPGRQSRSKVSESIAAVSPRLIECLSEQGTLLRALSLDSDDSRSLESPSAPRELEGDPNAAMLTHFANLIHRSYEHATEVAFSKMVELVERLDARTEAIERRLERAEADYRREASERLDDMFERAQEQLDAGGSKERIAEGLIGGLLHAQRTNGKGSDA
jgi:hypothetical protein